MIESAVIKNWVSQLINRLQGFNLLLLSITHFADLHGKIKYGENKDKTFDVPGKYLLNGNFFDSINNSCI